MKFISNKFIRMPRVIQFSIIIATFLKLFKIKSLQLIFTCRFIDFCCFSSIRPSISLWSFLFRLGNPDDGRKPPLKEIEAKLMKFAHKNRKKIAVFQFALFILFFAPFWILLLLLPLLLLLLLLRCLSASFPATNKSNSFFLAATK